MQENRVFLIKIFIITALFAVPTFFFLTQSGLALRAVSTAETTKNNITQTRDYKTFLSDQQKNGVRVLRFDSTDNLTDIPPEVGEITSLTSLEIVDNPITTLPSETANLVNLTDLRVTGTNLSSLPPELVKLTKLKNLVLSNNKLETVPDFLISMKNLQLIDLSVNPIPPQQIDNLKRAMPNTQIVF